MITLDVQDLRDMQCESGSLDLQSMDASTLSLTFARMDEEFLRRWVYGERLRLTRSGKTIFEGWIRDIEHSISAGARRVSISAADKWDDDGKNIYFARESTTSGYIGKATPNSTVYVADTVRDVLKMGGANIVTSPGTMSEMVPFASSSETRQNLTKKIGRWVPNLISRTEWDKPPGSDEEIKKVIIATPREYPPAIIDVSDIVTETIQLKPRYDLCPSSVTIIRHWTDSLGYNHTTTWTVPEGGNPHAVDAYVFETNDTAQGDNEEVEDKWGKDPGTSTGSGTNSANTPQRMTIKGRHIPDEEAIKEGWTTNEKFWGEYYPILKGLGKALKWEKLQQEWKPYDKDEPDPGASDSEAAKAENRKPWNYGEDPNTNSRLRYVLFEGELSDKMKSVRYVNATLTGYVTLIPDNIPAGHDLWRLARFFRDDDGNDNFPESATSKKRLRRILTLDCVLIDRFQASFLETAECPEVDPAQEDYPTDEDKEEAEKEIPADYAAAAEAYYNATRDLQYDGSITIRQTPEEAINYLGCHLSIKGGLPEWESMRTIVQGVSIDLMTDSVSLTLGSRDQEFETPKARNLTKEAREITEDERTSGNMAGSGGGSLADTNRTEEEKKEARGKKNRPSSPAIGPKLDTKDDPIEYHRRPFEITTKAAGYKTEEGHVYGTYGEPVKVDPKELSPEVSDWYLVYKVNKDKSIESAQITDRKTDVHSYDETQSTGVWPATYCIHLAHIENMSIDQKWTGDVYFDGAERHLMPFELYRLADKWLINGGKVVSPLGEPTDPALYQAVNGVIATPGKWYLNYIIDDTSKLVTHAELSQQWQPIHMYDKAYRNNEWPATYCIHVATVNPNGTVIQHHTGDVYFEAELYLSGGGEDNPSSSDSSSAGGGCVPVIVDGSDLADPMTGIAITDFSTPQMWHYSVDLLTATESPIYGNTELPTPYRNGGVYKCAVNLNGYGSNDGLHPTRRPMLHLGEINFPLSDQAWGIYDIESVPTLHTYGLTYAAKWTIDDDISPGAAPIGNPRILRGIVEIPKGGGLEIGAETDPDRPQAYHSMTDAELAAHGWVKVCGGMPDSVDGHTHALFMATRRGKIFVFQRTQNYDLN